MYANVSKLDPPQAPLHTALGLDHQTAKPLEHNKFFFASPLTSQRLTVLNQMLNGHNPVIIVIGECGSGKTTLMNQFVNHAGHRWSAGRIRLKPKNISSLDQCRNLNNRLVLLTHNDDARSVIIDDAHQLSRLELQLLIQSGFDGANPRKFQSIVMFAEPQIRNRLADIAGWLPPKTVIDKIHMTPLTENQTAAYLNHRVKIAGCCSQALFSRTQIRKIHEISGGLPGWINGEAYMALKRMNIRPTAIMKPHNTFENITHKLWDRLPRILRP